MAETVELNVIGNIYNNVVKGVAEGKTLISCQGSARCFAPGTMVRMADGSTKTIENIVVGDKVMGADGKTALTVAETHSGRDMMYRISPHRGNGMEMVVNSNHLLSFKQTEAFNTHGANHEIKKIPYDPDAIVDIPASEYFEKSKNWKRRHCMFQNTMVEMQEQELPIDPYYLGVWLGDGTAIRPHQITNSDKEVLDWFYDFAKQLGSSAHNSDRYTHTINYKLFGKNVKAVQDFNQEFYKLNLVRNKHIPDIYLYNSYENRLKLLAGLIDSDGEKNAKNHTLSISQKLKCIAEAIVELCRTCGFYTNGYRTKIAKMSREDGSVYECEVYIVEINHANFNDLNKYMKVERKKIYNKNCDRDYFRTKVDIEKVGVGEYYGFTLAESPYFLLANSFVSHNSGKTYNILIYLILEAINKKLNISIVRETLPALKRSVFKDFLEIMVNMRQYDPNSMNKSEMTYTFPNGSVFEFFAADNEQKVRGSKRDILFINEANEIEMDAFKQLRMRTMKYTIIDYNPSFTEEHWIFAVNSDPRTYHFISTFKDNPFLPEAVIDELNSYKYTNPALWRIFGEGQFAIVEGLVFPEGTWDEYKDDTDIPLFAKEERIGIDFGYTADPTGAVYCKFANINGARHVWVKEIFDERGLKTKQIAERLKPYNDIRKFSESADPRLIDELEDEGVTMIYPTKKYAGSLNVGIQKLQGYKIHVHRGSVNLKKELRNYCWQKDRHDQWTNTPIDKFNHLIDAFRYAATDERGSGYAGSKVFFDKTSLGFDF